MVRWVHCWVLLAVVSSSVAFAQTAVTEQSIAAKLQGPFVLLRGMYDGDKLAFDSQGNLMGQADKLPFSLSAVVIDKIEVNDTEVTIEGKHAMLEFESTAGGGESSWIRAVPFNKKLHPDVMITVARDPSRPEGLDAGLGNVFSVGFDDALVDAAPAYCVPGCATICIVMLRSTLLGPQLRGLTAKLAYPRQYFDTIRIPGFRRWRKRRMLRAFVWSG